MRNRIGAIFTPAILTVFLLVSPCQADVTWNQNSFDEILDAAEKESKHIFIDFFATWCSPCKQLDKVTYKDPQVIEFLNGIIPVKYDAEKGEGKILAERFRVKAFPTLVLLASDGTEIDRHVGYLDPEDFLETMQNYQKGINTAQYYEEKLKKNPADLELLHILGTKYADAMIVDKATKHLGEIIERDPSNEHGFTARALNSLAVTFYASEDYEQAVTYFKKLLADFPENEAYDRGLTMLARTYYKMGQEEKCIETYMQYVNRHPDEPRALNSFAWFCASRKIALDQALPLAKKAAELSDESPNILDTLAELYFAMGEYDKAVEIEEKAAAKEPEDVYYRDQIIKFLKAALETTKGGSKQTEF